MGALIKDSTTLDILVQLNKRFDADALHEMVRAERIRRFSSKHTLNHSFAVLGIVPADWSERKRWYKFLDTSQHLPVRH